jgi:hypothetical protein
LLPPGAQTGAALSFSYGKVRCSVPPDNLVAVGCNLLENLVHQIIDLLFENNDQADQDHNDQYDLDCPHTGLIIPEISYFSSHTRPRFLLFFALPDALQIQDSLVSLAPMRSMGSRLQDAHD